MNVASLIVVSVCVLSSWGAGAQSERKTTPGDGPGGVPQVTFRVHRLGTDHAEGISALDMNGDGRLDLLSGAYWYENPGPMGGEWKRHQYRTVGILGEFVSDCGEWIFDVNHDGAPDVVTTGWMTNGLWWYENPKKAGAMWQRHLIADSYDTEGGATGDINGDGKPDLALAHYNHSGILWVDFSGPEPKVHHVGGKEQDGHGIGIADVDGDGKPIFSLLLAGSKTSMPIKISGSGILTGTLAMRVFPSSAMTLTTMERRTSCTAKGIVTDCTGSNRRAAQQTDIG